MSPKRQRVNNQAHLFRTKLEMHLRHYAERMKLFLAEERLSGSTVKSIKEMREDPDMVRGVLDGLYKRARRKTKRKI